MNNPQPTPLEKLISDRRKRTPARCYFQVSPLSYSLTQKPNPKERKATSLYILRKCHPCRLDLPTIFLWHKAYYLLHGMLHAHY